MDILKDIINILKQERNMDFSGYRIPMLERRIQKRINTTKSKNLQNYLGYINEHQDELDNLIDVFTINVSRFFRNSLTFEYINKQLMPKLLKTKENSNRNLRIWSAGCSTGEEAYSMAILLNEFEKKEQKSFNTNIFATDIDRKALKTALAGIYKLDSVKKIKYGILTKYFTENKGSYIIDDQISSMVQFSFFDMIDKKSSVPPASIFGGFDVVLCRNVLIYFNPDFQKIIFDKLYKSLNKDGYLILGEAETPVSGFKKKFIRENRFCKIYRKIG